MKLFIKQKVFTLKSKFHVKDEQGFDRYYVEGEFLSLGYKLHVYDMTNTEVIYIEQQIFNLMPTFDVYIKGKHVATIVREFTFFEQKYKVKGLDWQVSGNVFAHEYEVTHQGTPIVYIQKEWLTWGDCYVLDVLQANNELEALAVVLAIDCVISAARNSN